MVCACIRILQIPHDLPKRQGEELGDLAHDLSICTLFIYLSICRLSTVDHGLYVGDLAHDQSVDDLYGS